MRVVFQSKAEGGITIRAGHILNREGGWELAVPDENEGYRWEWFPKGEYLLLEAHAEFNDCPLIAT